MFHIFKIVSNKEYFSAYEQKMKYLDSKLTKLKFELNFENFIIIIKIIYNFNNYISNQLLSNIQCIIYDNNDIKWIFIREVFG